MKTSTLTLLLAGAAMLAACGGGGGTPAAALDPDAMAEMDGATVATVQAFHGRLNGLPADDRGNPLTLDGVLPPTSDTAEPLALE